MALTGLELQVIPEAGAPVAPIHTPVDADASPEEQIHTESQK